MTRGSSREHEVTIQYHIEGARRRREQSDLPEHVFECGEQLLGQPRRAGQPATLGTIVYLDSGCGHASNVSGNLADLEQVAVGGEPHSGGSSPHAIMPKMQGKRPAARPTNTLRRDLSLPLPAQRWDLGCVSNQRAKLSCRARVSSGSAPEDGAGRCVSGLASSRIAGRARCRTGPGCRRRLGGGG